MEYTDDFGVCLRFDSWLAISKSSNTFCSYWIRDRYAFISSSSFLLWEDVSKALASASGVEGTFSGFLPSLNSLSKGSVHPVR